MIEEGTGNFYVFSSEHEEVHGPFSSQAFIEEFLQEENYQPAPDTFSTFELMNRESMELQFKGWVYQQYDFDKNATA